MKKSACVFLFALTLGIFLISQVHAAPEITLERVEVAGIQTFFVKPRVEFKDEKETGKDLPVGAIMNLAYVLNIKNPDKEPVMLDELTFTTDFDGFEVNTPFVYEDSWIPPGKTNQVRVVVTNETLPTIGNLSVGADNVTKLQEMKTTAGAMVKKWWESVGDFSFPIKITNGKAIFVDEKGKEIKVTFSGNWGGEKKETK
jgi:hypothetical protein